MKAAIREFIAGPHALEVTVNVAVGAMALGLIVAVSAIVLMS